MPLVPLSTRLDKRKRYICDLAWSTKVLMKERSRLSLRRYTFGRVRAMTNDFGRRVSGHLPPVSITGLGKQWLGIISLFMKMKKLRVQPVKNMPNVPFSSNVKLLTVSALENLFDTLKRVK